jgi:hypothetical protein
MKQIPKFCVVVDNIPPEINNLSVVYRYLCIVYIISHLLEEMYENQILILLKFHVLPPPMKRQTNICISDFW